MEEHRPWADLPDLLLLTILRFLHDLPDLYAFAGTCRSWRGLLRSSSAADFPSLRPPLLLLPPVSHPLPPAGFRLRLLDHNISTRYSSLLPREALAVNSCLGSGFGFLILRLRDRRRLLLVDACTGREIYLPELPPGRYPYYYAVLTAPPSSPDCHTLLFYSQYDVLLCRMNEADSWTKHRLPHGAGFITRVLVSKERAYAVNSRVNIFVLEFVPHFTFKPLDVGELPAMRPHDRWHFGPQLVNCGGEVLLIIFVEELVWTIHVYKLDFMNVKWVAVNSLGDSAIFIDRGGRSPVSCPCPEGWGGRSNCIYLVGPGHNTWAEFPLDGMPIDAYIQPLLFPQNLSMPHWPSPVWIYPSLFF